jgi:hypothetical protein
MWAGGPAMPSPGDPQAEPTIAKAINGGFDLAVQVQTSPAVSRAALAPFTLAGVWGGACQSSVGPSLSFLG